MSNAVSNNNNRLDNEEDEIDLGSLFRVLFNYKWIIIGTTFIGLLVGQSIGFIQTPVYKTSASLKIQDKSQLDSKAAVASELEQLKSSKVLAETVNALNLSVEAKPKYFSVIGEAFARNFLNEENTDELAEPMFSKNEFAWGGEVIKVERLSIPESWLGKQFTIVAGGDSKYQLLNSNDVILDGEVGKVANKSLANDLGKFEILISALKARPGTHFSLVQKSIDSSISQLSSNISGAEKSKGSGILELSIESPNSKQAMDILNKVIDTYFKQNSGTKSIENEKSSDLLEKQLSALKNKIDSATTELENYKKKNSSVNVDMETQRLLSDISTVKTQISQLQLKHDELRQKFTESHPYVETLNKQLNRLNNELLGYNRSLEVLPQTQQVINKLTQEIEVNNKLYASLLENAQKVQVDKDSAAEKSSVIDYAQLAKIPIKPNKPLLSAIGAILGLLLGVIIAFVRQAFNKGIEDPSLIEKQLNLRVIASVPHSANQLLLEQARLNAKTPPTKPFVLALENSEDLAIESIRNLRTNLHFTLLESKNNTIMITGPSPGIGKSFISLNLATVLANSGKKVLLIDADMRKGIINRMLIHSRDNGLSELISNQITLEQAIRHIPSANFDFIATGALPPNPSELLMSERFSALLESFNSQYDQVIIDSPPILAVTDAAIIGRHVGASIMVVKAGKHSMAEIEQSLKALSHANVKLNGIVFNDYKLSSTQHGYNSNYVYQYNYKK